MNEKLILLIDVALKEADSLAISNGFKDDHIEYTMKGLTLLRDAVERDADIHPMILRIMSALGVMSFKYFENTPLEDALINVTSVLYYTIPEYKDLKPLYDF